MSQWQDGQRLPNIEEPHADDTPKERTMDHVRERAQKMRKLLERWKVARHPDDVADRLTDVLTDLRHYATRYGLSFDIALRRSDMHHGDEQSRARIYPERDDMVAGAARCVHTLAWADCEENRYGQSFSGCELTSIAPPNTPAAEAWAEALVTELEDANEYGAYHDAVEYADRMHDAETFGHYLALEAMGHGAAWSDSHPDHGLTVPPSEQMHYHDRKDYGQEGIDDDG